MSTEDFLCAVCLGTGSMGDTPMNVSHPSFMTQSPRKFIPIVIDSMSHLTRIDRAAPYLGPMSEDLVEGKKKLDNFAFKDTAGKAISKIKGQALYWVSLRSKDKK